jgi:hypothetical protein
VLDEKDLATLVRESAVGVARPDVAAQYGAQFQLAGFNATAHGELPPGPYTLAVFAHRV